MWRNYYGDILFVDVIVEQHIIIYLLILIRIYIHLILIYIQCSGSHVLQLGLTMKLAATFLTGGERQEVRARSELYYRASLDTIAILERGETAR